MIDLIKYGCVLIVNYSIFLMPVEYFPISNIDSVEMVSKQLTDLCFDLKTSIILISSIRCARIRQIFFFDEHTIYRMFNN